MKKMHVIFLWLSVCLLVSSTPAGTHQEEAALPNEEGKAVVTLTALDEDKKEVGTGKAVVVSADGYVLTSYHLICQAESAEIEIPKVESAKKKVDWESVFSPSSFVKETEIKKKNPRVSGWMS